MRIGIQFAVEGLSDAHLVFENRLSLFSFKNSMSTLARASFQHQQPQPFSQCRPFSSRPFSSRSFSTLAFSSRSFSTLAFSSRSFSALAISSVTAFSSRSLNLRASGPPPGPRSLRFHRRSPLLHQHFSYAFKLPRIIHIKSESLARQPAPLHNPIRVISRIVKLDKPPFSSLVTHSSLP